MCHEHWRNKHISLYKVSSNHVFTEQPLTVCQGLLPLTPKSDKHLISPYNISLGSNIKVMRINEMITI